MILPDLHLAFQSAFDCAVVGDDIEADLRLQVRTEGRWPTALKERLPFRVLREDSRLGQLPFPQHAQASWWQASWWQAGR